MWTVRGDGSGDVVVIAAATVSVARVFGDTFAPVADTENDDDDDDDGDEDDADDVDADAEESIDFGVFSVVSRNIACVDRSCTP